MDFLRLEFRVLSGGDSLFGDNGRYSWSSLGIVVISMKPPRQSMLIADSFHLAGHICATIILVIFSDARHLHVMSYVFHWQSPTCTIMSQNPHFLANVSGFCLWVPSSSADNSIMWLMHIPIVRGASAATLALIPMSIVSNCFTLLSCDTRSIFRSGPACITCLRLFARLYSSQYVFQALSAADSPVGDVSCHSWWFSFGKV